ncbi:MAG: hypothetical protein J6S85_02085 [Methanobrevibacter sp.]|nr:hypothetical protein [Methanobrevibacter sp.]
MTVSSTYTDKVYQITGATTVFAWGQDYDSHYGSLVVTEETAATGGTVVTTYVEGADYYISNGDVVFNTAPSDTEHYIHITRDTYKGQPVEFHEGEDFPAEDFENALDRLAMVAQELTKGLANEKSEREAADTTLQQNIDNETTTRANGDLLLQNAINTESTRAQGVEGSLSNLTTTNKSNLVGAINEVDGDVSSINSTLDSFGDIVTHDADEFATPSDIPTTAEEVGALPDTTKYTANLVVSLNSSTYVLTIQLKDQNGDNIGTARTVDLPLENIIVSGSYDTATKSLVILLDNGDTITIPVGDLVDGLQTEITDSNKLDADLIDDSTSTKKLVTALEKSTWDNKQSALTFDTTPTPNSTNPVTSGGLYNIIGDVVTLINAL